MWICHSRLPQIISLMMILVQRSPLLRLLADGRLLSMPRFANVLKLSPISALIPFRGIHAQAGATDPMITPVGDSPNPASATVGEPFAWAWSATTPGKKARSYRVEGLPPGIEWSGVIQSSSLTAMQGTPTDAGSFTVEITGFHFANLGGEASQTFELVINVDGGAALELPVISSKLTDTLVLQGESVTLAVEAKGDGLSFAWTKDGVVIPDGTATALALSNVSNDDAGSYEVTVSNDAGAATSSAKLTVMSGEIPIPEGLTLFSSSSRDNLLRQIDTNGTTKASVAITVPDETSIGVKGVSGLAWDPVSEQLFGMIILTKAREGEVGDRVLASINRSSGVATVIGNPAATRLIKISGLTMGDDGTLYGVTGNDTSAEDPESLFVIDTSTAEATLLTALGNGDQGEAIAFNPDDGKVYHISGGAPPESQVFESIDLTNKSVQDIPLKGNWKEGKALVYVGNDLFMVADDDTIKLLSLDGGLVTASSFDHFAKGMALVPAIADSVDIEITSITRNDDGVLLGVTTSAGDMVTIEASNDLVAWEIVSEQAAAADATMIEFLDSASVNFPTRFYRAQRSNP